MNSPSYSPSRGRSDRGRREYFVDVPVERRHSLRAGTGLLNWLRCVFGLLWICSATWLPLKGAVQTKPGSVSSLAPSVTGAGNSFLPVFSADGQGIVFLSQANNLVTNDDLGPALDLFWRDLSMAQSELLSVGKSGRGGADQDVAAVALSTNGQLIFFETAASNLTEGDDNFSSDIFVRERTAGVTRLVSVDVTGVHSGNGPSFNPRASADGRFVVFESAASNLVPNDVNGTNDVFLRDLVLGRTTLVSATSDGSRSANGPSHSPAFSADGRAIAFVSHATDLVVGVTNRAGEVYVHDRIAGTTLWTAASHLRTFRFPAGTVYRASAPILSENGRFVTFKASGVVIRFDTQRPTNTVTAAFPEAPGVTNYFYFQDNPRASRFSEGLQQSDLVMSADGRYVAVATGTNGAGFSAVHRIDFETLFEQPVRIVDSGGTIGGPDAFETNLIHRSELISSNAAPVFARTPSLSADGNRLAFLDATNATTVQQLTAWVRDVKANSSWLLSVNRHGELSPTVQDPAPAPVLSASGEKVAWESPDDDLVEQDNNRAWDVFVRELATGHLVAASARRVDLPARTAGGLATLRPHALSADGQRLAFLTLDESLAPNPMLRFPTAVLHERLTGTNRLVSNPRGIPLTQLIFDSNLVTHVSLSADGRYAAFTWFRLAPEILSPNLFWRDLAVDRSVPVPWVGSSPLALGPDGRLVVFDSKQAADVGVTEANNDSDVYLMWMDAAPPPVQRNPMTVSTVPDNSTTGNGPSFNASLSPDGSWVVFQSKAGDLTPNAYTPPQDAQLLARRLESGLVTLSTPVRLLSYETTASPLPDGRSEDAPLPTAAQRPQFSADSRYVVFDTSNNLVYRHDLRSDFVLRVTSNQIDNTLVYFTNYARVTNMLVCRECGSPSVSGEGRYVAYEARPSAGGLIQLVCQDLATGQSELLSRGINDSEPNGHSFKPLLSHDARYAVFASKASNLVPNDINGVVDVFVRDRFAQVTFAVSTSCLRPGTANRASSEPVLSADGRTVAFQSFASDLVPNDYNDTRDVFVLTLSGPDTDGDGMDDDWEMVYFSTLDRDGTGDRDGDGASDHDEFRAGTNPVNDASLLRVLKLTPASSGDNVPRAVVLLWSSVPGRTYRLQFKTSAMENWNDLPQNIIATSYSAQATHLAEEALPHFYRVRLLD